MIEIVKLASQAFTISRNRYFYYDSALLFCYIICMTINLFVYLYREHFITVLRFFFIMYVMTSFLEKSTCLVIKVGNVSKSIFYKS